MSIGNELRRAREMRGLTQAELAARCCVTRQTVSSWENEKSYPDLGTLVFLSDELGVSLDTLLKKDTAMLRALDRANAREELGRKKKWVDFCTGAGTGLLLSCLSMPESGRRAVVIAAGLVLLTAGAVLQQQYGKKTEELLDQT